MNKFIVNVGNIGNIECDNIRDALTTYNEYVRQSIVERGRAGGEDVVLLINDEPRREYFGFKTHGYYTVSNCGGYAVEISDCGEMARMKDAYGSDNPKVSDWKEITYLYSEGEEDSGAIIDVDGYNIPLNQVMKL